MYIVQDACACTSINEHVIDHVTIWTLAYSHVWIHKVFLHHVHPEGHWLTQQLLEVWHFIQKHWKLHSKVVTIISHMIRKKDCSAVGMGERHVT